MFKPYERPSGTNRVLSGHLRRAVEASQGVAEEEAALARVERKSNLVAAKEAIASMGAAALEVIAREEAARPGQPSRAARIQEAAVKAIGESNYNGEAIYIVKNSLNGGEISPGMGGRIDLDRYRTGCRKLLNMVPLPCGGITKRPGFEYIATARGQDGNSRLVPFVFSARESRLLEFHRLGTHCGMSVISPAGEVYQTDMILPWSDAELPDVRFCQSGDIIYFAHENYQPGKIMRHGDRDWSYAYIKWSPDIKPPKFEAIWTTGTWPENNQEWVTREYAVTAIDEAGNESEPITGVTLYGIPPLSQSFYAVIGVSGEGAQFRFYRKQAGVYGFIGIAEPNEDHYAQFEDKNIAPDTEDTPPRARNPFHGKGEYPSLVFFHQQRLGFASSINRPLTFWLSQSGNFESMAASVPPDDSDAIEVTLATSQANRILWAESDRDGLAFGTEAGEWLLTATEGRAITPQDLCFQAQTYYGSQRGLSPLRAGQALLYIQRGGTAVREYGYNFQDDRYTSNDLSLLARHLLRHNPVQAWAWQREPYGIAWCALRDGTLAGLTYLREHDVIAWHQHRTDGKILDLASIPGLDGETQLWAIIQRGEERHIERLAPFNDEGTGRHVDGQANAPFQARCVPCLEEASTQTGSNFLKVRKISAIKLRVLNSKPFKARVSSQNAAPGPVVPVPPNATTNSTVTTQADWAAPTLAGFRDFPSIELIMDGPDPATILGLVAAIEPATNIGGQL